MQDLQDDLRLRPIDLAREHGLSTQAIRNYEDAGILPSAVRTANGYRTYTSSHARALRAFLALARGHGHRTATAIMRAVNEGVPEEAFRLVDESHAQLLEDRRTLRAVADALRDLEASSSTGTATGPEPAARRASRRSAAPTPVPGETFIGPLAARLGLRPATLRTWERVGLVHPRRDQRTGYRVYDEAAVRDAELAHQLRRGGYLLEQIAPLIAQVRSAGGLGPLEATMQGWTGRLTARGRALLAGAAALDAYLGSTDEREHG